MQPPSPEAPAGAALAADLAERAVLAVFFSAMSWSFLRSWLEAGGVASLILLVSEASVVVMVLARRRTSAVSLSPAEWLIAFLGTAAPLLARPVEGGAFLVTPLVCVPLMLAGFAIQIAAKFTLRRSFGVVAANRGVKVGGPYRIVRHPMYAGYVLTQIGFLTVNPTPWNLAVYALAFGLQISRIRAEERILGRDAAYRAFAATVRYRLAPGIF
ncbi:MAG TPA: isoprenylcysteine carboxylmethyltransferase family protein [Microvirga sp.]|nr:isoprenylcysteine carboxylmethyltransferase family protein [Microvirga sp.]